MKKINLFKSDSSSSSVSYCDYTYPESEILKNKYGIQNSQYLDKQCRSDSDKAAVLLRQEPLPPKINSNYLKHIHKCLFESSFEWAGHTRDLPFTFEDGTIANISKMLIPESTAFFQDSNKIKKQLQKFDNILSQKKELQGLSREEFIDEAVKLFSFLNYIHPFRDGNGRTQRLFFERLAEAAGHTLDFSVVTKQRMINACSNAIPKENSVVNYKEMKHLFEDISNPKKLRLLKDFLDSLPEYERSYLDNHVVIMPQNDIIYTGRYKESSPDSIIIVTKDSYVVYCKDYLAPEELKALKVGESVTFSVLGNKDLDKILVPAENLAPLKQEEIIQKIKNNTRVQDCQKKVEDLAKIVYGDPKVLDQIENYIIQDAKDGERISNTILKDPKSISKLSGFKIMSKIKSPARICAERNLLPLSQEILAYTAAIISSRDKIIHDHNLEQNRLKNSIKMPSTVIQNLLIMSPNMRGQYLGTRDCFELQKEICSFLLQINNRFSKDQLETIKRSNYEKIAKDIGISESKAKVLLITLLEMKKLYQQLQKMRISQPAKMTIAV
ncbi:BID domain-containing T4SS effector [Bartonella sp. JB63]|uniref:BID domain-containing T4SS effector n=1 Tax=Bartonella sp. JB63 TaxID=1933907 RepID=UPI0009999BB7|nr:BID domain-containing T4SS effector [Bartonella sp. JB63]AQX29162.1 Bartonella effector protein Bep7 [Bartonella sp. JB63]